MMYSLDVPLSRTYCIKYFNVVLERMRRIFKLHSEFEELPFDVQEDILKKRGYGSQKLDHAPTYM
jgi:hypothetical protein